MTQIFRKYIKEEYHTNIPTVRFKTNFSNCILEAMLARDWVRDHDAWDLIWSEKDAIADIYERKLGPQQKVNHFRHYHQICRKDLLIRNLKRHKKMLQRQGRVQEAKEYNFFPQTYVLPSQYVIFADEFRRIQALYDQRNVWIMKPTARSQGRGIFLTNKAAAVAPWDSPSAEPYIAQRYLSDPLLIGGKKFDLRLYALVTSYSPLTVYFYRGGFARFTHCRYEEGKLHNSQMHLTNVAVQKQASGYDQGLGGKWYVDKLREFMVSRFGHEDTQACFCRIQDIVLRTLEACQKVMASDKDNSFQLYGFDILLDSHLQPWLLEVNGSPSMTANTSKDRAFKVALLEDTLSVVDPQHFLQGSEDQIGGFDLITKKRKQPRISFLGAIATRMSNLRHLAKHNSARLNTLYEEQTRTTKRPPSKPTSSVVSKKNLVPRRTYKALSSANAHNISCNSALTAIPPKPRDFLIKQRPRRQTTHENDPLSEP